MHGMSTQYSLKVVIRETDRDFVDGFLTGFREVLSYTVHRPVNGKCRVDIDVETAGYPYLNDVIGPLEIKA